MPNRSKAENAAALRSAGIPQRSFSKPQFCARHSISEGLYQKLKKSGLGPRETHVLDRIIITTEDEDDWVRERQAASAAEAERVRGLDEVD
jgi:hypothetical protein